MHDQNLYELLQVAENTDQEITQAAYRRLVLKYHPDRSSGPKAAEMTQRLNDAYSILFMNDRIARRFQQLLKALFPTVPNRRKTQLR
jgi:curved DNA-binding protein CbpA